MILTFADPVYSIWRIFRRNGNHMQNSVTSWALFWQTVFMLGTDHSISTIQLKIKFFKVYLNYRSHLGINGIYILRYHLYCLFYPRQMQTVFCMWNHLMCRRHPIYDICKKLIYQIYTVNKAIYSIQLCLSER